jgi:hypothetical protein
MFHELFDLQSTNPSLRAAVAAAGIGFSVCLASCGGGSAPAAPLSAHVVTTQSIVVTMPSLMAAGDTAQATAVATLSNGSTKAVTAGFKSDVTGVATVSDGGLVTAVGPGAANIYVVADGQQGTKNIRVNPNYAGNWSGSYVTTGCSQTGDFVAANFCSTFSSNRVLPFDMILTQTLDTVSGTSFLGTLEFNRTSATIGGGGEVVLNATYVEDTFTIDCVWSLSGSIPGRLTGTVRQTWRDSGASGQMTVTGTIRDSMKTNTAARDTTALLETMVHQWQQRVRR